MPNLRDTTCLHNWCCLSFRPSRLHCWGKKKKICWFCRLLQFLTINILKLTEEKQGSTAYSKRLHLFYLPSLSVLCNSFWLSGTAVSSSSYGLPVSKTTRILDTARSGLIPSCEVPHRPGTGQGSSQGQHQVFSWGFLKIHSCWAQEAEETPRSWGDEKEAWICETDDC